MSKVPPYISASQLELFLTCPMAYKLAYIDGERKFSGNEYTAFGGAIHAALEYNYAQKIKSHKDLPAQECVDFFVGEFNAELAKLDPSVIKADVSTMSLQGEELIYQYMLTQAPQIQPLHVEMKFDLPLKTVGVNILGYIDLIDDKHVIHDYKTVGPSKAADARWSDISVAKKPQFTMYALAFRKLFSFVESGISVDLLKRKPKGPEFTSMFTTRTDLDIMKMLQALSVMKRTIEEDLWYCNAHSCGSCLIAAQPAQ